MGMELRHLRLVRTVAEEQNLTRAGKRLFLTQSALSHQLAAVEAHLGIPLFRRQGRRMVLTPAGERVLQTAQRVQEEVERMEADVRRLATGEVGVARISTECYTCYHWLPDVLSRFSREWPGVEIKVVVEATRRPLEALLEGRLDLAIVSRPVSGPGVRQLPLFEDELVAVAAPGHRWERLPFVGPEDFRDEHLILYTVPAEELTLFRDFLDPAGASPRKVSWMQLTEGIVELVRAGLGVTVMARWAVRPQLEAGTLRALPLGRGGIHREWSAVLAEPVPPYLLALVEAVAAHAIPALEPA